MIRVLMVLVCSMLVGTPQPPQQPPRDTPATPTVFGTASVSGRVALGDDANTPVRRAVVTLASSDGRDVRSAITNDDGLFTIGGLPEGRYSLTAKKPAHITSAFGARRPGRPGTVLVLAAGQPLTGLEWSLPRGGVLAGRITLANGEPAPNTTVMAIADRHSTSGGMLSPTEIQFRTDDRGEFRIYGLQPDRYLLAVVPDYGFGDIAVKTEGSYDAAVRELQQAATSATGGVTVGAAAPPPAERTVGLAPTYYPGTPIAADAARITIAPGDVKDGLDFVAAFVPVATLRGTIVDTLGQPLQAVTITAQLLGPAMPINAVMAARPGRPDGKGQFTITGLTPGRYAIRARAGGVTLSAGGNVSTVTSAAQTQWAAEEITVHGDDIEGFSLMMRHGLTFGGRITTVGPGDPPATWKGAMVLVQPVQSGPANVFTLGSTGPGQRSGTVTDDGTFTVTGLEPGDYEIRVTLPASAGGAWTLASVQHNDRDLRDAPLTFSQGSINDVAIVLTTERTELAGTLTSDTGTPATDYYIVAFPADRALWHPASPRVRVMRPAADGLFSTRDLPPGTYRLAALTDVEDDEHRRTEFLESIYEAAITIAVTTGQTARQDIRIR